MNLSMITSVMQKLEDIIMGIFAVIPQVIYFLYASVASLLDLLQMVMRKLAGLDVYYVANSTSGQMTEVQGDILKDFVEGILGINKGYSALSTVFWSILVFAVIVLVLATIFAIIKAQYNYDNQKSHPFKIIGTSLKALATMAITPLVVLFGVYINEILLKSLDTITAPNPTTSISAVFEGEAIPNIKAGQKSSDPGNVYYANYDIYAVNEWTNTTTFSGLLFDLMANSCNRVRSGNYTAGKTASNNDWDNCDIFYANLDDSSARQEKVATQIDYAFKNSIRLNNRITVNYTNKREASSVIASTLTYGPSAAFAAGLLSVNAFSKFNVGLVWYYYNLWGANYLLGFAGIITILTLLINIVFGLMKRLVFCVALFMVNAPVAAITPLDGGNGFKSWRKTMISYFISAYGATLGLNLFFLILPTLQNISFFNIVILDKIMDILIIFAGLTMVKKLTKLISSFIGAADLNDEGQKTKKAAGTIATSAARRTLGAARLGVSLGKYAMTGGVFGSSVGKMISSAHYKRKAKKELIEEFKAGGMSEKTAKKNLRLSKDEVANRVAALKQTKANKAKKLSRFTGNSKFTKFLGTNAGQMILSYTGIAPGRLEESNVDPELDEKGQVKTDASGNPIMMTPEQTKLTRGKKRIIKAKDGLIDLSGTTIKAIGRIANLNEVYAGLKKKGVVDDGKLVIQDILQVGGIKVEGDNKYLATEKQQKKYQKKQNEKLTKEMNETADYSAQAAAEVFKIAQIIRGKP